MLNIEDSGVLIGRNGQALESSNISLANMNPTTAWQRRRNTTAKVDWPGGKKIWFTKVNSRMAKEKGTVFSSQKQVIYHFTKASGRMTKGMVKERKLALMLHTVETGLITYLRATANKLHTVILLKVKWLKERQVELVRYIGVKLVRYTKDRLPSSYQKAKVWWCGQMARDMRVFSKVVWCLAVVLSNSRMEIDMSASSRMISMMELESGTMQVIKQKDKVSGKLAREHNG